MRVLIVGIGGFLGALARYYLSLPLNSGSLFPWGTLVVNLAGSFFLALFLTVALKRHSQRSHLVLAVSTGFTGSFTTFSSVSVEIINLSAISPALTLAYVLISFTAGLGLAFSGRRLGEFVNHLTERMPAREAGEVD